MRVPEGIRDHDGRIVKGEVILQVGPRNLKEYGREIIGNHSTCHVLTSPGDIITVGFAVTSGVEQFVDLVVDGVLRASVAEKRALQRHRGGFGRVFFQDRLAGKRKSIRVGDMQVCSRDTGNNLETIATHEASAVGSLEVQIFRKEGLGEAATVDGETPGSSIDRSLRIAQRAPTFDDYSHWSDVSRYVGSGNRPPSFEIRFVNPIKATKPARERVLTDWSAEYKLFVSFKFCLRSKAELQALGFNIVEPYYLTTPPRPDLTDSGSRSIHAAAKIPLTFISAEDTEINADLDDSLSLFVDNVVADTNIDGKTETTEVSWKCKDEYPTLHLNSLQTQNDLRSFSVATNTQSCSLDQNFEVSVPGRSPIETAQFEPKVGGGNRMLPVQSPGGRVDIEVQERRISADEGAALSTANSETPALPGDPAMDDGKEVSVSEFVPPETLPQQVSREKKMKLYPGRIEDNLPRHAWLKTSLTQDCESCSLEPHCPTPSQVQTSEHLPTRVLLSGMYENHSSYRKCHARKIPSKKIVTQPADESLLNTDSEIHSQTTHQREVRSPTWELLTPPLPSNTSVFQKEHFNHDLLSTGGQSKRSAAATLIEEHRKSSDAANNAPKPRGQWGHTVPIIEPCIAAMSSHRLGTNSSSVAALTKMGGYETHPYDHYGPTMSAELELLRHARSLSETRSDTSTEAEDRAEFEERFQEIAPAHSGLHDWRRNTHPILSQASVLSRNLSHYDKARIPEENSRSNQLSIPMPTKSTALSPVGKNIPHRVSSMHTRHMWHRPLSEKNVTAPFQEQLGIQQPGRLSTQQILAMRNVFSTNQAPKHGPQQFHGSSSVLQSSNEKRKADSITGNAATTVNAEISPRKSCVSPSSRGRVIIEREVKAARARLEAATKKKEKLVEEFTAVLFSQQERERVKTLNDQAEQLEKDNEQLQARIDTMYREDRH